MFTGEALRKVFTTLVLFFALVQIEEPAKVFFIEEPEAHLYPTLQDSLIVLILQLAIENHVQLFITTNSQHIFSHVTTADIFVLQKDGNTSTGRRVFSSDDDLLATAVKFPILGLRNTESLLIIEGDQDYQFIKVLTECFKINTTGVQFLTCAKFKDASHFKPLVSSIQQLHPRIRIHVIRDNDFFIGNRDDLSNSDEKEFANKGVNNVKVFYWDLPTIESYLFLDWCKCTHDPFSFLKKDGVISQVMAKYFCCWRDTNSKIRKDFKSPETKACDLWLDAMKVFDNSNPSQEDCLKVARVLHGHLWIQLTHISRHDLLRELYSNNIVNVYPSLKLFLVKLFKFE